MAEYSFFFSCSFFFSAHSRPLICIGVLFSFRFLSLPPSPPRRSVLSEYIHGWPGVYKVDRRAKRLTPNIDRSSHEITFSTSRIKKETLHIYFLD